MNDLPEPSPSPANLAWMPQTRRGLHVFADGCFEPVSGKGGWAFVAYRDGMDVASNFGGIPDTSNNAMEVVAVLKAAIWINGNTHEPATIWSDSVHAVRGCNDWLPIWKNNGWRKIDANTNARRRTISDRDLWKALDLQLSQNPLIDIVWCKGHSGIPGNERADGLADAGRLSMPGRKLL